MLGSTTLEIAIGLVFIYLLFSLIATAINEGIATFINKRGKNLFDGITNLLNDPTFTGLAQQIYSHGLVDGISQFASDANKPNRAPSYMSSDTFALALIDILGARGIAAARPDQATLQAACDGARAASAAAAAAVDAAPSNPTLLAAAATANSALAEAEKQWKAGVTVAAATAYAQAQAKFEAAKAVTNDAASNAAVVTANTQVDQAKQSLDSARSALFPDAKKITPSPEPKRIIDWRGRIAVASLLSQDLQDALRAARILAANPSKNPDSLADIQAAVEALPTGPTQESLLILIAKTKRDVSLAAGAAATIATDIEQFQKNVEKWFNDSMERVAGWYKRWAQIWLLGIGCLLVFAANADTLTLAKRFSRDTALRTAVVAAAEDAIKNTKGGTVGTANPSSAGGTANTTGSAVDQVQPVLKATEQLNLPLGWLRQKDDPLRMEQAPSLSPGDMPGSLGKWLLKLLGLMITVAAISLGAPFWFDTLSKFINIRGAGTPPGETKTSASQTKTKQ